MSRIAKAYIITGPDGRYLGKKRVGVYGWVVTRDAAKTFRKQACAASQARRWGGTVEEVGHGQ